MSSRLVTRIQDIKGIPGKYKRVLCAWAAFANNDGTSIRPKKESVGAKAGVSRWTVYKNTDDLIDVGILVDTGEVHPYPGGHWVPVYRIDLTLLDNSTELVEKLRSKIIHGQCSKTPKSHVAKGDSTLSLESSATLQTLTQSEPDSSALTSGVSESVSQLVPSPPATDDDEHGTSKTFQPEKEEMSPEQQKLLTAIKPLWIPNDKYAVILSEIEYICEAMKADPFDVLRFNRAHKKGALYVRTPEQFLAALEGKDEEFNMLNDYATHDHKHCKLCYAAGVKGPQAEPKAATLGHGFDVEEM